jgi:phasin family protein
MFQCSITLEGVMGQIVHRTIRRPIGGITSIGSWEQEMNGFAKFTNFTLPAGAEDFAAKLRQTAAEAVQAQQAAVSKLLAQSVKVQDEAVAAARQNVDAANRSLTLAIDHSAGIAGTIAASAKDWHESAIAASKAVLAAKTLSEVAEVQTNFAKTSYDKVISESVKISELSTKAAKDVFAPIGQQLKASAERFSVPAAA